MNESRLPKQVVYSAVNSMKHKQGRPIGLTPSITIHTHTQTHTYIYSVVTDSESATESATESSDFPRVRPSPNPWIICSRKWQFWVMCSRVNIYLSGGGIQAMLRKRVWPPVRPCERLKLNKPAAGSRPSNCYSSPLSRRPQLSRQASTAAKCCNSPASDNYVKQ